LPLAFALSLVSLLLHTARNPILPLSANSSLLQVAGVAAGPCGVAAGTGGRGSLRAVACGWPRLASRGRLVRGDERRRGEATATD
jgi:hypothetical protein